MSKRDMVRAVYILYVIGFFTGLSTILGVIFAYFNRDSSSLLEKSHFDYQISIFWKGLLMFVIGIILAPILIGYLVILFWMVWTILKIVKGWSRFADNIPMTTNDVVIITVKK